MLRRLGKSLIVLATLFSTMDAFAAVSVYVPTQTNNPALNTAPPNPSTVTGLSSNMNTSSTAASFAMQAGQIAGVVQACGQDVSVFMMRVGEAVDRLAISAPDRVTAMLAFQRVLKEAQAIEQQKQPIPCDQAIKDYNSLPILRPDYKETVLSKLAASNGSGYTVPNTRSIQSNQYVPPPPNAVPAQPTNEVPPAPGTFNAPPSQTSQQYNSNVPNPNNPVVNPPGQPQPLSPAQQAADSANKPNQ